MTPEDRDDMLAKLTPKQRAFVEAYVENGGNALSAAQQAGYKTPHVDPYRRGGLLENCRVQAAIRALTAPEREARQKRILKMAEIQEWWSAIITGREEPREGENLDRLSASDKLARSLGGYLDRSENKLEAGDSLARLLREINGKSTTQAAIDWDDNKP